MTGCDLPIRAQWRSASSSPDTVPPPILVEGGELTCLVDTATGRVFQLHPVAAAMWPAAYHGGSEPALVDAARSRFDVPQSARAVAARRLLFEWRNEGWLDGVRSHGPRPPPPDFRPVTPPSARLLAGVFCPFERPVALHSRVAELCDDLEALLAPATVSAKPAAVMRVCAGESGRFAVFTDSEPPRYADSLAGARWHLTRALVTESSGWPAPPLTIHGAAVAEGSSAVALVGASGAGKTTLAAALLAAGLQFLSDDIVPLDAASGTTAPIRLAMACKAGAWESLARLLPEFGTSAGPPLHDGKVRYFWPADDRRAADGERPKVRIAVLPSYGRGATPKLTSLRPYEFLAALGASGAVFPAVPADLGLLLAWVEATPAFALTYGDAGWAVAAVRELMAGFHS